MRLTPLMLAAAILATSALAPSGAAAQTGCAPTELADPPRQAYDCGNGLVIEAEAGLLLDLPPDAAPDEVVVGGGAVLVELPPDTGEFQIRTPHAIASVRGTVFVVEVGTDSTSVLVVEGAVEVSRADGGDGVLLAPGQGIDVVEGEPLAPQHWAPPRAAALLARFGR